MEVRLQKLIASTGLSSRRKAEMLIASGRVSVNGKVVTELGTKVDPDQGSCEGRREAPDIRAALRVPDVEQTQERDVHAR